MEDLRAKLTFIADQDAAGKRKVWNGMRIAEKQEVTDYMTVEERNEMQKCLPNGEFLVVTEDQLRVAHEHVDPAFENDLSDAAPTSTGRESSCCGFAW